MKKENIMKKSETDWDRIRNMGDKDIDFSDLPEVTPEMFANAVVRKGFKPVPQKKQLTLRIDQDVIEFFRKQGQGYQTKINQLLRAYMDAHHTK
ncbi:MAG: BrnA antitoxin family protein [Saprospiraceae bacterium]|nr:BrnA antitoxin family protein [Pyrinomonadaceae bacterium]